MSDPTKDRDDEREDDGLELEPETVKDLDVSEDESGQIRGGCSYTSATR